MLAADVNSDERVRGSDVVLLRKLILEIDSIAPAPSWQFVDAAQSFLPIEDGGPWPVKPFRFLLARDTSDMDLVAIKTGDINNSVEYDLNKALEGRSNRSYLLYIESNDAQGKDGT